ncbi:MAG: HNH endonuclease signature motif containing protein [Prochlorococcaceae cyanobacterium]
MDHIVPRNQGGSDDLSNLQALCVRCNAGKRRRALLEDELALCIADA